MELLTESIDECSVATEALPKMKLAKLAKEMPCPTEAAPGVKAMFTKEDESEVPTDGGTIRKDDSEAELCSIHSKNVGRLKLYGNKLRCNQATMAVAFRKKKRKQPKVCWKEKRMKRGAVTSCPCSHVTLAWARMIRKNERWRQRRTSPHP